jgi:hypothetical protein
MRLFGKIPAFMKAKNANSMQNELATNSMHIELVIYKLLSLFPFQKMRKIAMANAKFSQKMENFLFF